MYVRGHPPVCHVSYTMLDPAGQKALNVNDLEVVPLCCLGLIMYEPGKNQPAVHLSFQICQHQQTDVADHTEVRDMCKNDNLIFLLRKQLAATMSACTRVWKQIININSCARMCCGPDF